MLLNDYAMLETAVGPPATLASECLIELTDLAAMMNGKIVAMHGRDYAPADIGNDFTTNATGGNRTDRRLPVHVVFVSAQTPPPASDCVIPLNDRVLILHAESLDAAFDTARRLGLGDHPHLFVARASGDRISMCRVDGATLSPVDCVPDLPRHSLARDFSQILAARRLMRRSSEKTQDHGRRDTSNWIKSLGLPMNRAVDVSDIDGGVHRFTPSECRHDPIIYIHGGGLVHYDLSVFSPYLSHLADLVGATVFAVGYRKCPENAAEEVIEEILQRVNSVALTHGVERIMGDSVGGLLALYAACRTLPGQIREVVLLYPVLSLRRTYPSYEIYGDGYLLDEGHMRWFRSLMAPWLLSKGFDPVDGLQGELDGVRVIVVSAGCDVLADEAVAFSRASGALHLHHPDLPHDFCLYIQRMASATVAITDLAQILTQGEPHAELPR